jgi:ABC-type transporter lipoprotein component MlaA
MEYRDTVDNLKKTSLDYYVVLRSLYSQKIASRVKDSTSPREDGPVPLEDNNDEGPRPLATPE